MSQRKVSVVIAVMVVALIGCETTPPPLVVGNLTARDIEYALADSMMITFNSVLFILRDSEDPEPNGFLEREGLTVEWSEADIEAEIGEFYIQLEQYRLASSLFSNIYKGYVATGTVSWIMDEVEATLVMDLTLTNSQPDRYPVRSLDVKLSGLEENIDPDHVEGHIIVDGYDVPLDFSRSFQISN